MDDERTFKVHHGATQHQFQQIAVAMRFMPLPIRRFTSLEAMKAEDYRYWQSRAAHERLTATAEISIESYHAKDATIDGPDFVELLSVLNADNNA